MHRVFAIDLSRCPRCGRSSQVIGAITEPGVIARILEGQEDQLGALGLVTNAVVLWNTIYMDAAINQLREQGEEINEADLARLSPLLNKHINMLGHYSFTLAEGIKSGVLRPLNDPNAGPFGP